MGGVFYIASYLFEIGIASVLAPSYVVAGEATRPALAVMASTLHETAISMHELGHVLSFGIGYGLFSLAILRTSVAPKWLGWLGLFVALTFGFVSVVSEIAEILGFLAAMVWTVAMGVILLRLREPGTPATGA